MIDREPRFPVSLRAKVPELVSSRAQPRATCSRNTAELPLRLSTEMGFRGQVSNHVCGYFMSLQIKVNDTLREQEERWSQ